MRRGSVCPPLWARAILLGTLVYWVGAARAEQTLDDGLGFALRSAITAHPTVRSKLGEIGALGYQVEESQAARYPSLTAEARSRSDATGNGVVRLSQPLWAFGRIDQSIELAQQRRETARLELLELRRKLMEDTAVAYNQVLTQRDRLRIAQLNETEHANLLALISRRVEGGLASAADVRLASLRLAQARLVQKQIQGALDRSLQDLHAHTQSAVSASQAVDEALITLPPREALTDLLLSQHASIQVRRQRLQVVSSELSLRKLEALPTVSARLDRPLGSAATGQSGQIMLVLEGRLDGAGLAGSARVNAQALRLEAARQDIESAQVEFQQRLSNLLIEQKVQADSIAAQSDVAQSTRETMDSIVRQYDAGRKSWLDLLNTQRELADVRQQLALARGSWREQSLRIAIILGLLDPLAEVQAPEQSASQVAKPVAKPATAPAETVASVDAATVVAKTSDSLPSPVASLTAVASTAREASMASSDQKPPVAAALPAEAPLEAPVEAPVEASAATTASPQALRHETDALKEGRSAVEKAVLEWAKAWSDKDTVRYYEAYDNNFIPAKRVSRAQWESDRRVRIVSKKSILVEVREMQVSFNGDTAVARFQQLYTSDKLKVKSRKTLEMVRQGHRWLIVRELVN